MNSRSCGYDLFNILGVQVSPLTSKVLNECLANLIRSNQHRIVLYANAHGLNLCCGRPWLRHFFNKSEIVFCDGAGVMLGAWILGYHIPERITYADWMWNLAAFAAPREFTFYFLGAKPGVADRAAQRLITHHPDLRIVGVHHGYFDKTPGSVENEAVIREINDRHPNILVLGLGMPLQERWLLENWAAIEANVALTGGAVFDYLSGELRRAPRWMTDNCLEWLGRLIIEPRRLWKRYLIGNPLFVWRVLKQRLGLLKLESTPDPSISTRSCK